MIDIEKCKNEFIKYVQKYNLENDGIKRKFGHSLRVMENSRRLAELLKLDDEDVEIATLIGLLHDIGRFDEYSRKKDNKFDHGDHAVEILENNDYILNYVSDEKYIKIILKAIKNHNKLEIEKGLDEKTMMFCKIIRDSDKLDILYEGVYIYWNKKEEKENVENTKFSKYMEEEFVKQKPIKRLGTIKNDTIDGLLMLISYIYDINFKESLQIIEKEDYINKILDRFNFKDKVTKEKVNKFKKIINNYIKG